MYSVSPFWEEGWTVILRTQLLSSSEFPEKGVTAWVFATHLRRDTGWWQSLKEELGGRLLRTQSSVWVFTNSTCCGWRTLLILVRGTPWEGGIRNSCFHLLCSLPSSDTIWTSYNRSYLLRISFSPGLHGQQNLCMNIMTCMEIVICKRPKMFSDLLCDLETKVSIVPSVVQRMACEDPLLSLCVSLCAFLLWVLSRWAGLA